MRAHILQLTDVQIGYQPRGRLDPDPKGTHRIIQIKDIDENSELNTADLYRIVPERDPERYLVRSGDILFLSRGRYNAAVAVSVSLDDTIAAGTFYIARVKIADVLPSYIAWFINQHQAQAELRSRAQATNIPLVTKAAFEGLEVEVPPLAVQRNILKVADLARKERELLARLVEKRKRLVSTVCLAAAKGLSQE